MLTSSQPHAIPLYFLCVDFLFLVFHVNALDSQPLSTSMFSKFIGVILCANK